MSFQTRFMGSTSAARVPQFMPVDVAMIYEIFARACDVLAACDVVVR